MAVCVIPVSKQLSLKEVATTFNVKKVVMANKNEAQKVTGYLLGGIVITSYSIHYTKLYEVVINQKS